MQRNLPGVEPATKSVCQRITSKNPPNLDGHDMHGRAILVFRLQTPARKCEIINCLPVVRTSEDGWVDEPEGGHVTIKNFSDGVTINFSQL